MNRRQWSFAIALLLLFLLAAGYKTHRVFQNPLFQKPDDRGVFWTESAMHYRWARMVAMGEGIPRWDQRAQYPEGIYPFEEETPVMEWVAGHLYRWLPVDIPFHKFVAIFNCVWHTLALFPLYGVARLLGGNPAISFLCAALYAFSIANISGPITGSFVRENFALPFIFAHFYFFILALRETKIKWAVVSGLFLYLALLSWHLAQFYFALLVIFMATVWLWKPTRSFTVISFIVLTLFSLLGGATIPSLLKGGYLLSYSSLICLSLIANAFLLPANWSLWKKRAVFVALTAVLCLLPHLISASHLEEFSHVYQFLKTKILYLGHKPADPSLLPYEGKVMWMSSFETPSWKMVWNFFALLPFLALPAFGLFIWAATQSRLKLAEILVFYFCGAFLFFYWLMIRMDCFLVFFLAAAIAYKPELKIKANRFYIWGLTSLLLLGFLFNFYKLTQSHVRQITPPLATLFDLIQKISVFTEKDDPILTPFPFGPTVVESTGRPVIIHSKFENATVRRKVKEFEEGFFKDEKTFYELCQKYSARYVVIDVEMFLDLSSESLRYRTNNMKASRKSVLYKMHFAPEELKLFKLITSNDDYRLYRVLREGESRRIEVPTQPAIYDIRNFTPEKLQLAD